MYCKRCGRRTYDLEAGREIPPSYYCESCEAAIDVEDMRRAGEAITPSTPINAESCSVSTMVQEVAKVAHDMKTGVFLGIDSEGVRFWTSSLTTRELCYYLKAFDMYVTQIINEGGMGN